MSRGSRPTGDDAPGTLTSLVDEVFRGSSDSGRAAWVEGLSPGTALGRYDLLREVGRGGFGVVWEARDRELGRRVAVKVIRSRPDGVPEKRLVAEAEVAARLSHPNIVTVLDVGRGEKGAWLVQEFLAGRTLAARLDEGPLPLREALRVARELARGLAHAHAHGVVHRDLTARNVFLCEDGQVKLLDLGMAQAFGRRKLGGGTPDYMAPEQVRGAPEDERVDVFALGVLLYEMVTGTFPFPPGPPSAERRAPHLETPELPGLGELVDRLLSPEPMDRPRDAGAVLAELEELGATLPRTASGTQGPGVRVRRRWPAWAAWTGAIALGAVAAAGGAFAARWGRAPSPAVLPPVSVSARATTTPCDWGEASWTDLDRKPEGAIPLNGELGGQGIAEVGGRKAWLQTSDWNGLFLPLGRAENAAVFAIEAEFFYPDVTRWQRGADVTVFTDPPEPPRRSGETVGGISIGVQESPGRPPQFNVFTQDPVAVRVHQGFLPRSLAGSWHVLRIEGSRSGGWMRFLLDGEPLVFLFGRAGLDGRMVRLGSGYGYTNPEDVAWSNLRTFAGSPQCQ